MISLLQMKFHALLLLLSKVWTCICFMFNRQVRAVSTEISRKREGMNMPMPMPMPTACQKTKIVFIFNRPKP